MEQDVDSRSSGAVSQENGAPAGRDNTVVRHLAAGNAIQRRPVVGGGEGMRPQIARAEWDCGSEADKKCEAPERVVEIHQNGKKRWLLRFPPTVQYRQANLAVVCTAAVV